MREFVSDACFLLTKAISLHGRSLGNRGGRGGWGELFNLTKTLWLAFEDLSFEKILMPAFFCTGRLISALSISVCERLGR